MIYITRKEHFNAAHKLFNEAWSEEKNDAVFGKCANANWHGHNYELHVTVKGTSQADTGFVFNAKRLSVIINEYACDKIDHKNLNLDVPQFKDLNPTAENIAVVIWNLIREKLDSKFTLTIRLYGTERNFFEYSGY